MIQPGSKLSVQDNSGGRLVECIRVLKKSGRKPGTFGDYIVVSVKKLRKKGRIKVTKKEVCIALIVNSSKSNSRFNGIQLKISLNSCVLLNRQFKNLGTRVFGTVRKELRGLNNLKLLLLSSKYI